MIDDVAEGFENAIRQPSLSHELTEILWAVELTPARRQLEEQCVGGDLEFLGAVPARPAMVGIACAPAVTAAAISSG